ncbi:MAG: hypothetical protein U1D30_17910 [Planctomycetota bacterium]
MTMNFILVGNDPSAAAFVKSALARGYRMLAYVDVPSSDGRPTVPPGARGIKLDEIPAIEGADFLVLSGNLEGRAERLKGLLRTDPVDLVVATPLSNKPDIYYELALVQQETKLRAFPLLPEGWHPALERIDEILSPTTMGGVIWLEWTHPLDQAAKGAYRFLDGWTWFRAVAGELESVTATGSALESDRAAQVVASLRARSDLLCTTRWLATNKGSRFVIQADKGRVECELPEGIAGKAILRWTEGDEIRTEMFPADDLGERWLDQWEDLVGKQGFDPEPWKLAARQVEVAEAVERSLDKGRAVDLTYDEVTEEASFKSIMTIFGCSLIWATLLVAILAAVGVPYIGYLVLPAFVIFAAMQLFGLVFKKRDPETATTD